jgi:hypothetical protein
LFRIKARWVRLGLLLLALASVAFYRYGRSIWVPLYLTVMGRKSVDGAVAEFGERADALLRPAFVQARLSYPPKSAALLCFKQEKRLELWAKDDAGWAFVSDFEIMAASGKPGPKLKEGDRQVPEGVYRIEGLNPNSSYHVSMKLNYPNEFDVAHAKSDGRSTLGATSSSMARTRRWDVRPWATKRRKRCSFRPARGRGQREPSPRRGTSATSGPTSKPTRIHPGCRSFTGISGTSWRASSGRISFVKK